MTFKPSQMERAFSDWADEERTYRDMRGTDQLAFIAGYRAGSVGAQLLLQACEAARDYLEGPVTKHTDSNLENLLDKLTQAIIAVEGDGKD